MKSFFTIASLFMVTLLSSFKINAGIDDVVAAMKTGNASQLAKFFDNNIEIAMPDKSNTYSKSQGELVLKDFFNNNGVITFEVIHSGDNAGAQYVIGNLQTKKGTYRTTIYIKQKADKQVLQEIRFEK